MKKTFLILAMAALLFCCGCGSSVPVEGTWYSVTDTTMYNFKDNEITVSGVVVGQYEDNGDSVVISMIADGSNLQLYVTQVDGVDVLADVREGDGTYYFCKGLENAQAFVQQAENRKFQEYIETNLCGYWICLDKDSNIHSILVSKDHGIMISSPDGFGIGYWSNLRFDTMEDGRFGAILDLSDDDTGANSWQMGLFPAEHTYDLDQVYFGTNLMRKTED